MAQLDEKSTSEHLATYLNDHLAGATAAVNMLNTLKTDTAAAETAHQLLREVESDKRDLEALMLALNIDQSRIRQAVARVSGRFVEMKGVIDDSHRGVLARFELVEALSLGIEGKRALWTALAVASARNRSLRGIDYHRLTQRADDQRRTVEELRLRLASDALGDDAIGS